MKLKELANSDEVKDQSGNEDGEEEDTLKTLSPHTPSPSSMGNRKKKLKEIMHVKSCDQSSKIIKKPPKSTKVLSDHASKSASSKKRVNSLSKTSAMVRAEEVMSSLDPKFPTCLKTMVRSHVSSCFWMGLSTQFCKSHLPKEDVMLTVEDENGKEFEIKYLFVRTGLSGGWKNFAIANKLLENDVVVFQLVKPLAPVKLKAYIIRANDSANEDGATINLDSDKQQNDAENGGSRISEKSLSQNTSKRRLFKSLQHDAPQKKKKTGLEKSLSKTLQQENKFKNGDEESDLEIIPGPSNPPKFQFVDVKSFEEFTIIADGLCIDSELPDHIRRKYYQLCSDKKAFLHARLMQGLNSKLIAGIIFETVSIADLIKKCNLTTCRSEFANWERALKSFHFMGMRVGFIIARIRKLVVLAFESEDAIESRKYMAIKLERILAEDELVNIKSKFGELKETYKKCGGNVKSLKSKAEAYEHKFQEEVGAPW